MNQIKYHTPDTVGGPLKKRFKGLCSFLGMILLALANTSQAEKSKLILDVHWPIGTKEAQEDLVKSIKEKMFVRAFPAKEFMDQMDQNSADDAADFYLGPEELVLEKKKKCTPVLQAINSLDKSNKLAYSFVAEDSNLFKAEGAFTDGEKVIVTAVKETKPDKAEMAALIRKILPQLGDESKFAVQISKTLNDYLTILKTANPENREAYFVNQANFELFIAPEIKSYKFLGKDNANLLAKVGMPVICKNSAKKLKAKELKEITTTLKGINFSSVGADGFSEYGASPAAAPAASAEAKPADAAAEAPKSDSEKTSDAQPKSTPKSKE